MYVYTHTHTYIYCACGTRQQQVTSHMTCMYPPPHTVQVVHDNCKYPLSTDASVLGPRSDFPGFVPTPSLPYFLSLSLPLAPGEPPF